MSRWFFPTTKDDAASKSADDPLDEIVDHCWLFIDGVRMPGEVKHTQALEMFHDRLGEPEREQKPLNDFIWLSLNAPNADHMYAVAEAFDVHDLIVEDIVSAHQRPKVERYDNQLFMVLKSVKYSDFDHRQESVQQSRQVIEIGEVQMVLGAHFIITIRHNTELPDIPARLALPEGESAAKQGPMGLAWAFADALVDDYRKAANELSDDVDLLEEEVFTPQSDLNVDQIYLLKREILEMGHAINPLESALNALIAHFEKIRVDDLLSYFRDVLDHELVAKDSVSSSNERLTALIDAAVAKISLQQNADMRAISAYVGMAAVPTLVAGIYGMNFQYMPELAWRYGYFIVLGIMMIIVIAMWWAFKKRNWL